MSEQESGGALYCGVDIGASATKLAVIDSSGILRTKVVHPSGADYAATARECLDEALGSLPAGSRIARTVATGHGRRNVAWADDFLTEIHCHAAGCYHHVRRRCTIVDIGGQDNKVIHVDTDGKRTSFKMNRKCAAGTGAFLEEIAVRLNLPLGKLDSLAAATSQAVQLSSFCTVFAKTEILTHLRMGAAVESIVRGAFLSVATRVLEMDPLEGDVVLTGGVAEHNPVLAAIVAQKLGRQVIVPPDPQHTGALGAALLAMQ
ncbi:MAG: ATPase [Deltaproteobacteria bacterium]|nr:ATPase [Deltaproteobacteria bacterium]